MRVECNAERMPAMVRKQRRKGETHEELFEDSDNQFGRRRHRSGADAERQCGMRGEAGAASQFPGPGANELHPRCVPSSPFPVGRQRFRWPSSRRNVERLVHQHRRQNGSRLWLPTMA